MLYRFPFRLAAVLLLAAFCTALPLAAQAPNPGAVARDVAARSQALQSLERVSLSTEAQKHQAAAADSERAQRDLTKRLTDFANAWNKLITLAEKGVWNAKQAAKTRQLFDKLIHSSGWIEENKNLGGDE